MTDPAGPRTYILTGSPEYLAATREHGFRLVGLKQGRRRQALEIEPGERIVLYVTRMMAFAGSVRVIGECFEDHEPIWPSKRPGEARSLQAPDPYPWRLQTEPELVLEEHAWVPAEQLVETLEHIAKWPRAHWRLAFQGQIRAVSDHDAAVLLEQLGAAVTAHA